MAIPESLCCFALKLFVGESMDGIEGIKNLLTGHFTDRGNELVRALERSNRKAWKALEVALAGPSLWGRLTDRAEQKGLRTQLQEFLNQVQLPEETHRANYRAECLRELKAAFSKGLLLGELVAGTLLEKAGVFANRADSQALLKQEKQALAQLASALHDAGFMNLSWLQIGRASCRERV